MGGNGHRIDRFAITLHPSAAPRHPALGAALQAARPALVRLYSGFQRRRQAQIAEFVASFCSTRGRLPTAPDVAAGLEPPISIAAAAWYLTQDQGGDSCDDLPHSLAGSPHLPSGGAQAARCRSQIASVVPLAQHR